MVETKKEEFMTQIEHYRAVLSDLERQRNMYALKINEIDQAIASLHRLIPEDAKPELPPPPVVNAAYRAEVPHGKFTGMSVRWAILYLLSEMATGPMTTGEIAAALRSGGIQSAAAKFAGNVSAILSVMRSQRAEVVSVGEGWTISENGKQAWAHIRAKREADQQATLISSPNVM